jgi:hypothetical protein
MFDGSAHVRHLAVDPKRYWRVIKDMWDRSQVASEQHNGL